MPQDRDLKTILERNEKAIRARPSIGQGVAITRCKIRSGVTCDVEDGDWKLVVDQSAGEGGAGLGPDPGVFGRAALGSCLAIGYVEWGARLEVPIDSVEVVVEAGYDARGMYGIEESVSGGWTSLKYTVHIESPADEAKVQEVIEKADKLSPLLDDFSRALQIERVLKIAQSMKE